MLIAAVSPVRSKFWRVSIWLLSLAVAGAAQAEPHRLALLIGANQGHGYEMGLRYAEEEARRLGETLRLVGGFEAADVVVLEHPDADELRRTLTTLGARVAANADETLLFVFYSGHADAEGLHLSGERFPLDELRETVAAIPASARVLIVDACRSGALTRVKGGRPGPNFDMHVEPPIGARGFAILTSSAAGEDAQESDEVGSSLFTHYLNSALMGAGDSNSDGSVTIEEAFAYASDRTIVAASATSAGPQHPTFRYELGGRGGLVLTRPGRLNRHFGLVQFPESGWYLVQRSDGPVVAELRSTHSGQTLALEAGRYRLTKRLREQYFEGEVDVAAGEVSHLSMNQLQRYSYPRGMRKGGLALDLAPSEPSLSRRLSRRWWFWTATIGGAAVVAGAIALGVFESQPHETTFQVHQP
jgi:hypothetical protein